MRKSSQFLEKVNGDKNINAVWVNDQFVTEPPENCCFSHALHRVNQTIFPQNPSNVPGHYKIPWIWKSDWLVWSKALVGFSGMTWIYCKIFSGRSQASPQRGYWGERHVLPVGDGRVLLLRESQWRLSPHEEIVIIIFLLSVWPFLITNDMTHKQRWMKLQFWQENVKWNLEKKRKIVPFWVLPLKDHKKSHWPLRNPQTNIHISPDHSLLSAPEDLLREPEVPLSTGPGCKPLFVINLHGERLIYDKDTRLQPWKE